MTILFVGVISGVNVYFYTLYGITFPYGGYAHAVLFGISTIGGIMIMKAFFDLLLNDYIEEFLLQRQIENYWSRKGREEDNRKRVRESMKQFQSTFPSAQNVYGDNQLPIIKQEPEGVSPSFLTMQ
tara:strand:+ start:3084 stop:3461 length:378 start_codon:yes stop_codon:yes gene_type:complete